MGNVLDCSTDPLDQIHESDADQPRDVDDVHPGDTTSGQSGGGGNGGDGGGGGDKSSSQRTRPEVLYLERNVPLRDSIMWKLQRQFYKAHHVHCWEKMVVPCFVTSNSFIARAYARVLVAFMRDWFLFSSKADQSEPMLILEVGAGHGKFACLVLQHLLEMREFLPSLSDAAVAPWQSGGACDGLPFRYVVTDVAQGTLDYVRTHSSMQGFLEQGLLEVALFDAEDPIPSNNLHLQVSDKMLDLNSCRNPMATVCNYVFDSLQQDAFRIKNNILYENRVSITSARSLPEDISQLALNALQGLGLQWEHSQHSVAPERTKAYYAGVDEGNQENINKLSTEAAREKGAGDTAGVNADEVGYDSSETPPQANKEDGFQPSSPAPEEHHDENGATVKTPAAALDDGEGISNKSIANSEGTITEVEAGEATEIEVGKNLVGRENERDLKGSTLSRTCGAGKGGGGCPASNIDSDFDCLLADYVGGPFGEAGGGLLIPLGGLRLLKRLSSLCLGRCLVLVGDKGYVSEQEMGGQRDPHIAYHGSLSCMVNMDALCRYTRLKGGWSIASPYMEGFKCQALAFGLTESALQETRFAFEDATQVFGPESFSTLQRAVKDEVAQPSLGLVLQLLRASMLDPDVFMKFRASLVEQVSSNELAPSTWEDLKVDTLAIADRWYPLQQGKDVNFEAARLLMALKDFESAIALFRRSERMSGEHYVTCHNMGMSFFYLGKMQEAKECFERSLQLDEAYEDSVQWLAHVRRNMMKPVSRSASDAAQSSAVAGSIPLTSDVLDDTPVVVGPSNEVGEFNINTLSI